MMTIFYFFIAATLRGIAATLRGIAATLRGSFFCEQYILDLLTFHFSVIKDNSGWRDSKQQLGTVEETV